MVIDGRFYVRNTALGEELGCDRPRIIRVLIERHVEELTECDTAPQVGAQYTKRIAAQDETAAHYLNNGQALPIVRYSEASSTDIFLRR